MPMPQSAMGMAAFEDRMSMNETEWQNCEDPVRMLRHVRAHATPAQLRMFGCACCRRLWKLYQHWKCTEGVEVAERVAAGLATEQEREFARERVQEVWGEYLSEFNNDVVEMTAGVLGDERNPLSDHYTFFDEILGVAELAAEVAGRAAARIVIDEAEDVYVTAYQQARVAEERAQCQSLRDTWPRP